MIDHSRPDLKTRLQVLIASAGRRLHLAPASAEPAPVSDPTETAAPTSFQFIKDLGSRLNHDRTLGLGAEMAFWLFLSLLPLAAVAGLVVAKLAVGSGTMTAPLIDSLPAATQQLVQHELSKMAAWNSGSVGIGGALMFVWLASSGVHSVFDGIELQTEAVARSWWKKRLLAIASCVALSVGICVLTVLVTGLTSISQLLGQATSASPAFTSTTGQITRVVLGFGISFGLVSGLYWVALPPRSRRKMPIFPGALLAVGLQTLVGLGYGFYIKKVGDGGAYQAGLASIGVTLMGLYLFCLALLVGVEFNQMLGERRGTVRKVAA